MKDLLTQDDLKKIEKELIDSFNQELKQALDGIRPAQTLEDIVELPSKIQPVTNKAGKVATSIREIRELKPQK